MLAVTAAPLPAFAQQPAGDDSKPPEAERADAGVPAEARDRYERGIQLYNEGVYDASLLELQRAYKLAPTYRILYNIAKVQRQMRDYAGAVRTFERYLREGGSEIPEERRTEVEQELGALRNRVARIQVATNVEGAEITIDDVPVGKTPLNEPVLVNAGQRRVGATKAGRVPVQRIVSVAGNDSMTLTLDLLESNAGESPGTGGRQIVVMSGRGDRTPSSSSVWLGWTATGLLAGGAVASGVLALNAKSDLDDRLSAPTTPEERDAAEGKVRNMALLTDILAGAAIVAGGISVYFTIKSSRAEPKRPAASVAAKNMRLGVGLGRVNLEGRF